MKFLLMFPTFPVLLGTLVVVMALIVPSESKTVKQTVAEKKKLAAAVKSDSKNLSIKRKMGKEVEDSKLTVKRNTQYPPWPYAPSPLPRPYINYGDDNRVIYVTPNPVNSYNGYPSDTYYNAPQAPSAYAYSDNSYDNYPYGEEQEDEYGYGSGNGYYN